MKLQVVTREVNVAAREVTPGDVGTCGYTGSVTGGGMGSDRGRSDMMVTLEVTVGDTGR